MDQTGKNLQSLTQFINFQFLKRVTQLLLSVSLFSFFFTHSYLLSFLHSFNFSRFPLQLATHTIDKNCIFLLCNGILVFLAKYSGLTTSLSGSNHDDESFRNIEDVSQPGSFLSETKGKEAMLEKEVVSESIGSAENGAMEQEKKVTYLIEEVEKETEQSVVEEGGGGGGGGGGQSWLLISKEEEEKETGIYVAEDEEEDREPVSGFLEEEGNSMLSTEELNRKFDDFIRRMKEEIRIEGQRQLVMV